jgi:hypothetical protein
MSFRRNRRSPSLATQTVALAAAVPQVVAQRVIRMALAGPNPTARDRREFQLMGAEKVAAFYESWNAMYVQALRIQLDVAASVLRSVWFPWAHARPFAPLSNTDVSRSALAVLGKGMAPVRRRAVANAARLRRQRLR